MKITNINASNYNIKNPADYTFDIQSPQNFMYTYDLGISLTLPEVYSEVVVFLDTEMTCNFKIN